MTGVLCPGDERDERVTRGQVAEEGSEDMTSSDPITSVVTSGLERHHDLMRVCDYETKYRPNYRDAGPFSV